jgi:hypothetical protein
VAGPAPELLAALEQPSLWLSERDLPAPAGLPPSARYEHVPGPHSFTQPMRAIALPWLDEQLGHRPVDAEAAAQILDQPPHTPGAALRSPTERGDMSLLELALAVGAPARWSPRLDVEHDARAACVGEGPFVLTAGAAPPDRAALQQAGLAPCELQLADRETWEPMALTSGHALADRPASALRDLSEELGGAPIYAVGPWAIPAAASGVPWVGRAPLRSVDELDPLEHPSWVHVPGGWWGGLEPLYQGALALDEATPPLVEALAAYRRTLLPQQP